MKEDEKLASIESVSISEELDKSKRFIKMYDDAYNFNRGRFDAYAELMSFYQGTQHLLDRYKTKRPWIVNMNTPYATIAIENRLASLKSSDYEGDLLPLSPEDIDIIEPLDRVQKREWERMNMDKIINQSLDMCAVVREAYCHIFVDNTKTIGGRGRKNLGALCAEIIEPSCVLIDPSARSLKDADYFIILGRITKKKAFKEYPILESLNIATSDGTPMQRGEIYYENDYTTSQEDELTVWNFYEKVDGKVRKTKLINKVIVKEEYINISRLPVLQIRWKKAAQSCYGLSLMDQLLCLQKAVCSIESAITNTAIAYAAPSMMVSKGSGVDPKKLAMANGAPGVVYSVNGNLDNAMKPVIPPKIQQEILNIKTDYENKIKEISGNTNQFLGNIGTAANTAGGAELAVDRAKIIEANAFENIEEYVEDIVNVIVEFITKLYPNKILNYYVGKNGKGEYEFDTIKMPNQKSLKNLEYNFYVELDKKSPYSKEKQKQNLKDLFQFERQYDVPIKTITVADIIKNSDLENKDEIIERFNNLSYQDAETKAQTIEKLITTGTELGINQELITSSISEIISNQKETPATDELLKSIEQGFSQQMKEADEMSNMESEMMQQGVTPEDITEAEDMIANGEGLPQ